MSFREKSIWVSLVVILLAFGYYFINAFNLLTDPDAYDGQLVGWFIGIVVVIIILEVTLHIVLAIASRKEAEADEDEREHLIELKATRFSYFILASGVFFAMASAVLGQSAAVMATIILFFFVLAEVIGYATQLVYLRRGV